MMDISKKFPAFSFESVTAPLCGNPDYVQRLFPCGPGGIPLGCAYLDSMVNREMLERQITSPLLRAGNTGDFPNASSLAAALRQGRLPLPPLTLAEDAEKTRAALLSGSVLLWVEGANDLFLAEVRGYETRAISEPPDESVYQGARDAFVESLQTNVSLIRRRLKSEDLVFLPLTLGRRSHTAVYLAYVRGVVREGLPEAVRARLSALDLDALFYPGALQEALSASVWNPFPQYLSTQRPDRTVFHLLQGGVAVLAEGFSAVTLTPATLGQFLINLEEYNYSPWFASFLRILRACVLVCALLLPAFYVAILLFHQEMIPVSLALFIQESKQSVPLTTVQEVLWLLFIHELLLEAGMRVPKAMGSTVTIISGLVVGEAAVSANLLSPLALVLVTLSVIAGLNAVTQDLSQAIRLWRILFVFAAWAAGLVGVLILLLVFLTTLATLEVFGVPYLSPSFSVNPRDLSDSLLRAPLRRLLWRFSYLGSPNERRRR